MHKCVCVCVCVCVSMYWMYCIYNNSIVRWKNILFIDGFMGRMYQHLIYVV